MYKFAAAATLFTLAAGVSASHTIKLVNKCSSAVTVHIDGLGAQAPLQPGSTSSVSIANGAITRICQTSNPNACPGNTSITEFTFDAAGVLFYDISNIDGFTIAQSITTSCGSVTCSSATCPCDQAYLPGQPQGCPDGVDRAVHACSKQDATVTYCP